MFRIPDLRGKILFTLLIIGVYRLGSFIPAPGIDLDAVQELKRQAEEGAGVLGFLQLFSGGALTQFALFALGIMPYITRSEEHTSELQSLMRISYAVFCLIQKNPLTMEDTEYKITTH